MRPLFPALQHRDFRLLFAGQLASSSAQWMDQVTRGYLVYELTGSVFLLGLVQATRAVPLLLFGVLGGVLADREEPKHQLLLAQLLSAIFNLVLAVLVALGLVQVWHVFATAFLSGCAIAIQQPARQSLIPSTVKRPHLMNALAMNSGALNLSRSIGPAVAGAFMSVAGVAGAYLAQAGLFLLATFWTVQLSVTLGQQRSRLREEAIVQSMVAGFKYIIDNRRIFALLVLSLLPIVLAQPYSSLLPIFARDIFQVGPSGLGILLSSTGVGALVGVLSLSVVGDFDRKGWFMLSLIMAFGVALVGFALTPSFWIGVLFLGVAGLAQTSYRVVNQGLLHNSTADRYRGRVMSFYLMDRGLAPLGSLLAGTLAELFGAPFAVGFMGALTFAAAVAVCLSVPDIRRM